jgi:hypothetical protein
MGLGSIAQAQSTGRRGVSLTGSSSSHAMGTASATLICPVQIKILHWPEDFANTKESGSNRWQMFSVNGASDFAIDVKVPTRAVLRSPDASLGSVEVTGIHNTSPEHALLTSGPRGPVYSGDLRFGLLANPPEMNGNGSESASYQGSCAVTVNYN